jgi:hypothetical protein
MDPGLVSTKFDEDSPEPLWELVIAQLAVAGVTAAWHLFAAELGLDRTWAERYIFSVFYGLNVAGVFLGPLVVIGLLTTYSIRRNWKFALYAGVEAALWFAHFQALRPWM